MANPITNKVKTGGIPVIKKDLEDGVIAEANNDGTIYLDKKVKNNTPLAKEAIAHEMVHMDQMARGDLDYNDDKVFWKGKSYDRDDMNEGAKNLPWEKEAYNKTKNMKKSPAKLALSQGALDTNKSIVLTDLKNKASKRGAIVGAVDNVMEEVQGFDAFKPKDNNPNDQNQEDPPTDMNKKNKNKVPFKMKKGKKEEIVNRVKAKSDSLKKAKKDNLKKTAKKYGNFVANTALQILGTRGVTHDKVTPFKSTPITKKSQYGGSPFHIEETDVVKEINNTSRTFDGNNQETGEFGTFTETKTPGVERQKKESVKNFENSCYNEDGSKKPEGTVVNGILCSWAKDEDFDPSSEYTEAASESYKTDFKPNKVKEPGTPDKRNMGYYESMDTKWGAGVRNRGRKKLGRILDRAGKKFDKGKGGINPETGEQFDSKADYLKYVSKSYGADYNIPVGKTRFGTKEGPETNEKARKDEAYYKTVDGQTVKTDKDGNVLKMSKKNKNKSAFKMKGWSAY